MHGSYMNSVGPRIVWYPAWCSTCMHELTRKKELGFGLALKFKLLLSQSKLSIFGRHCSPFAFLRVISLLRLYQVAFPGACINLP